MKAIGTKSRRLEGHPWLVSVLLGLSLGLGCGDNPDIDDASLALCADPGQEFELGVGIETFSKFDNGQELWFIPGFQGGFHVWGAIKAGDVDPVDILMTFELYQDDQLLGGRILPSNLQCDEDQRGYQYVGVPVELHFRKKPTDVVAKEMEMRVTLTERDGTEHVDSLTFMPRCCERYD